jgi:hypothetical protein
MKADVKLTVHDNGQGQVGVNMRFPGWLSKALVAKGYTRATIEATEDGFLVHPYVSEEKRAAMNGLPDWLKP